MKHTRLLCADMCDSLSLFSDYIFQLWVGAVCLFCDSNSLLLILRKDNGICKVFSSGPTLLFVKFYYVSKY